MEEAEVSVGTERFAAEDVSADDPHALFCQDQVFHRGAGKGLDVGWMRGFRAGDSHFARQVQLAGGNEPADGGNEHRGHRPDRLSLLNRGDVADLHTDIAGGVFPADDVQDGILRLVERGLGIDRLRHRDMDPAVRQAAEGIDTGLEVGETIPEGEIRVRGERRG